MKPILKILLIIFFCSFSIPLKPARAGAADPPAPQTSQQAGSSENSSIARLSFVQIETTSEHIIVRIRTEGEVEYRQGIFESPKDLYPYFFVDIPNSHTILDKERSVFEAELDEPSSVFKIKLAQYSLLPPVSRIVFSLRAPVIPTIEKTKDFLAFKFPVLSSQQLEEEKRQTAKEREKNGEKASPSVFSIKQIKIVFSTMEAKLIVLLNKPLSPQKIYSPSKNNLMVEFSEGINRLPESMPHLPRGIIQGITLVDGKLNIQLTQLTHYQFSNKDNELSIAFEIPVLDRIVTLRFNNEDIRTVILVLFRQYGANIIADPNISGTVTAQLDNVPLRTALDQILKSLGYGYKEVAGGILRVVPLSEIQPAVVSEAQPKLETKFFPLKFADATELSQTLQKFGGPTTQMLSDQRTKTLIITDTAENLAKMGKIIQRLDTKVPEEKKGTSSEIPEPADLISLEKKIIKLNYINPDNIKQLLEPFLSEKGSIQVVLESTSKGGRGAGSSSSRGVSSGTIGGGAGAGTEGLNMRGYLIVVDTPENMGKIVQTVAELDVPTPQVEIQAYIVESTLSDDKDFGVNWTAVDSEESATFSFMDNLGGQLTLGTIPAEKFTGVLKALSTSSNVKVLSNPHITVLENQPATFHSGKQVPYTGIRLIQQGIEEVSTEFLNEGTLLNVIPQVKSDDLINLIVSAEVSSLSEVTDLGPTLATRKAETQVLVKSGSTVKISGLTSETESLSISKVPLLGDIPLLGRLFTSTKKVKKQSEITIFITPRIVKYE